MSNLTAIKWDTNPVMSLFNHLAPSFLHRPAVKQRLTIYIQLTRLDRPIGILLLLWPTLWALWVAAEGFPQWHILLIFIAGVVLMRSGGCVINDFADRNFDGQVERTQNRPLAKKLVSPKEALLLAGLIALVAFILVLFTNQKTVLLSFGGVALATIYPFMKRYTHLPQVVLGAAFAWSVPMAYTAQTNTIAGHAWLIYASTLIWTVAYDTLYAMVDRRDDLQAGIKSTAILFGKYDRLITGILQYTSLVPLLILGQQMQLGWFFHLGLVGAALLFAHQQYLIRHREEPACFKAFLNNHYVGMSIFAGLFFEFLF